MEVAKHSENCPVCDLQLTNGIIAFCPNCNWELILIPESASKALKDYYTERLKLHKAMFNEINKQIHVVAELKKRIEKIEKQRTELEEKNRALKTDLSNNNEVIRKIKSKTDELESSKLRISDLEKEVKKLKVELKVCKQKNLDERI